MKTAFFRGATRRQRHASVRASSLFATVVCTLVAVTASAFSVQNPYMDESHKYVSRWATPDLTYFIDSRAVTGISATESQNVMKDSFQDWEDIDCSSLNFTFAGTSSSQDVLPISGTVNGKNELVWVTGTTECRNWTFGSSTLGVTLPMQDYFTGEIYESDIAFNNCDYNGHWAVDADSMGWGDVSFKSVAIHEIGHFFGQQHPCLASGECSDSDPPTMAPYVDYYGRGDDLNKDDKLGACFLYPDQTYYASNKGLYRCSTATDCPRIVTHTAQGDEVYDYENFTNGRLQCAGGYCIGVYGSQPATTPIGVICQNPVACAGGICTDIGDGKPMCTEECSLTSDTCPSGYHCETSGQRDICVIGSKQGEIGDTCELTDDCLSNYCFTAPDGSSRTCRQKCRTDVECPDGEYCWLKTTIGGCFPSQTVTLKEVGEFCTAGSDCESGLCKYGTDGMLCRESCVTSDTCPEGFWCDPGASACLPGEDPFVEPGLGVGEECVANEDCESGICRFSDDDGQLCRESCSRAGDCPDGWHCDMTTSVRACMPGEETVDPDLLEDGQVCALDDECQSGLCFAAPEESARRCRSACDLEDWFCPQGTACVAYPDVDSGVCMPSDGRLGIGGECEVAADCISGVCLGGGDNYYCSQTCEDWCPNGYYCAVIGSSGSYCLAGEPPESAAGGCSAGNDGSGNGLAPLLIFLLTMAAFAAYGVLRRRAM